jgi:hypothetical protein
LLARRHERALQNIHLRRAAYCDAGPSPYRPRKREKEHGQNTEDSPSGFRNLMPLNPHLRLAARVIKASSI